MSYFPETLGRDELGSFIKRLRGRLEGRLAMNQRSLDAHAKANTDYRTILACQYRVDGLRLALMDLEYVEKEFDL